ncbi:MAG: UDP-4-amino-4,6-dideoxy-N-acetyl-beta-L-altrosamine transaminase [Sphingomonas sp.]|nr:UDP-4-amino-4,6-dideoxy-N-acetyl-beta-L-altrosamine transaminase [Sphingomonas sp.]
MIPYGRQNISTADVDAVVDVLRSDFLTQGPMVPRFETCVADRVGAAHAVAVNSATSALHIACLALGLKPGDLLWTSPITFVASANAGAYCGADIDFVDIDPTTLNLCPLALERKLVQAKAAGRLPKVIIPVHMGGLSCEMDVIAGLARTHGIRVIEDASHAIGGSFRDTPIGSCQYSDVTVFSFHPVKIVTTAEGGLATTNDPALARAMELFRSHGVTREPAEMEGPSDGPWYYQQIALGYNYRMTEVQAALGISQMARLEPFIARRHALAKRYDALLASLPVRLQTQAAHHYSGLHLYIVQLDDASRRSAVFAALRAAGIGVNVHYIPVHTQPWYRAHGHADSVFANAEDYYARAISLPMYPDLTEEEQDYVVAQLAEALAA